MVNCVEFRSEDDADVSPYCHSKDVEVLEVELGAGIQAAQARLHAAMTPVIRKLVEIKVRFKWGTALSIYVESHGVIPSD